MTFFGIISHSVAGTTERIFETKSQLYDVYVNNQNVTVQSAALKDILKVSSADREKFDKLNNLRFVFGFVIDVCV